MNPPSCPMDEDVITELAAITMQHALVLRSFGELLRTDATATERRAAHRNYREAAQQLLQMIVHHNALMADPSQGAHGLQPWDLVTIAQPLVQQMLIEADLALQLRDVAESTRLREDALRIAEAYLPSSRRARERRSIAMQRADEGRMNEALTWLDEVKREFVATGDAIQLAQTVLEVSVLLEWLGDDRRALALIGEAGALVRSRLDDRRPGMGDVLVATLREAASIESGKGPSGQADEAAALWRIAAELEEHEARVRKARGEYDEAARIFEKVLREHYRPLGRGSDVGIEYQLASIDVGRGRFEDAARRLATLAPHFENGPLLPRRAALRLAQVDAELGLRPNSPAALELVQRARADLEAWPNLDLTWKVHWRHARALEGAGNDGGALDAYDQATAMLDTLRATPLGYRLDSTFFRAKLPMFHAAIDLAEHRGDGRAGARFIERAKSRALVTVLSVPPERRVVPTELEAEYERLARRMDAIEFASYESSLTAAMRDEHERLAAERRDVAERIRIGDPRWRSLTAPAQFDVDALARVLAARHAAALTLFVRDDRIVSVLVAHGDIAVSSQGIGSQVRSALEAYAGNLRLATPDYAAHDFSREFDLDADALIPRRFLQRALAAEALLVVPHGDLHLLPWSALSFDGARLFERTAVGVLPNLACVTTLAGDTTERPGVAVFGAPDYGSFASLGDLPDAGGELAAIEQLYAERGRLLARPVVARDATEEALRALATRPDARGNILHVACHGAIDADDPMNSGLLLTDGRLDAGELAMLRIHYDEVVLSACSTGWRPSTAEGLALSGDDALGLPAALLEAGARAVIASIPKAHDAGTRAFMTHYHRHRVGGETSLHAFRSAQVDLLREGALPPHTWVGLVCHAAR